MKLTKYLMIAGAALLLTACSNDDWNTDAGVTVEMANATMRVKENVGAFKVPLKLNGTTNGPVRVDVQVAEYSENPAKENVHYLVTSYSVVFPNDSAQVAIEIFAENDMELNEDRAFTVTISHVEGATIGAQASTLVTIRDDDGLFYEAIQGKWKLTGVGFFDGASVSNDMTMTGVDEDNPDYEKLLTLSGFGGASNLVAKVEYEYDNVTNRITLYMDYGQVLGQLNFTGLGACDVVLCAVSDGYLVDEGTAVMTVSEDLRGIEFDPNEVFYYAVFQGDEYLGGWDGVGELHMSR